ncbi:MAG: DUF1365 domain-containing protein [Verrucomicrobiota bacterium]
MPDNFQSSLYECDVVHERLLPRRHGFRYHLFFMDLWLDELPQIERELRLFSVDRFNAYSFRDADHLDLGAGHLRLNLEKWLLENHGVCLAAGSRIRLVTLPRVAGYFFNPVCFYFVYDASGKAVHALCEVTNTFHEVKPYFLAAPTRAGVFELIVPKHFYVSPFSRLDTSFHFKLEVPGEEIRIQIDDLEGDRRTLVSWIHGHRRPLTDSRLAFYFLRYPALTLQVIGKIHWQAFLLWWRGFEFFSKRTDRHLQTDLYRPHSSLTDP